MARRPPDLPSLVGGLAVIVLGAILLLDHAGVLDLRFAGLGPLVCAAVGAVLLATGLVRRD